MLGIIVGDKKKYKIVVADDEDVIREVVKRYLTKRIDAEVFEAESGEQAVETVRNVRPDLLFLDVTLVGSMSGWRVVEEIRKFDKNVRIVMVTGHVKAPDEYAPMIEREVVACLQKPVSLQDLYAVTERVLGGVCLGSGECFTPPVAVGMRPEDQIAHDLSNIHMIIQMHCEHFLLNVEEGRYKEASKEKILDEMRDSFHSIHRKCADLEKIVLSIKKTFRP